MPRAARSTQTSESEFLDLRALQIASTRQQEEIGKLRVELHQALAAAAATLTHQVAETASERDQRWASKIRHLERTQATALDHARAAAEAQTANKLAKQKDILKHTIGEELEAALGQREAELEGSHRELEELRGKIAKRDIELEAVQQQLAREHATLESERER